MFKHLLPLIPADLLVDRVVSDPDRVTITTHPSAAQACCPACGRPSSRIHSHYTRTLDDLPWQGRPVTIMVQARRFRCATAECPRRVFTERLYSAAPRARRSQRLGDIQRHIGLAVGGEPGSRLSHRLANRHGQRLRKRYGKVRGDLFTFLTHPDVPPDNNGSERELRPTATYRKVTGGFRSD